MSSWATSADSGFRLTGFTHGSAAILGRIRAFVQKLIERELINHDGDNTPTSRPVDVIDARAVLGFAALEQSIAHTAAAASLAIAFTAADAGACILTVGNMVACGVDNTMQRRMGGFAAEQTFELEGSLTYTPSV